MMIFFKLMTRQKVHKISNRDKIQDCKCSLKENFIRHKIKCVFQVTRLCLIFGPRREKTCLRGFANNTGVDQPAHPRSLISAFVIRFLESFICKLATGEINF